MNPSIEARVNEEILSHYQSYYRLAFSYLKNREDAMDVVQESVYKAMSKCQHLKKADAVSSWMYKIVVNTALQTLRLRSRAPLPLHDTEPPGPPERSGNDPPADLAGALDQLEEKDRAVLILRYFEDKKLSEVALILDEKESTVKSRLYRALKKMKLNLEQDGPLPPFEIGG